jgi:proline racemase
MKTIQVIDSHTAGEPTRVIIQGGPELGGGSVAAQAAVFRAQFDKYRSAVVNEPRGSDVMVGALLCPPQNTGCAAGVIFFNNVGLLSMCGHGTIGVVRTLQHLGKLAPGDHRLETPVGIVSTTLHPDGQVSVRNVPSWRKAKNVTVTVEDLGQITGDVAWGGNWFFICERHPLRLSVPQIDGLTQSSLSIRRAVHEAGFAEVDHVELVGPPTSSRANAKSFVLCPGGAYDRSPCGTGTSAKLACLAADGKLAPGEPWVQQSIIGTYFTASYQWDNESERRIVPTITGSAFITAESKLFLDESDPFCWGIPATGGVRG